MYNAIREQITGNHRLYCRGDLQYNTDAADAIAKFITESVAANTKNPAAKDLRSYFNAVPRQPVDNGDLYSP